MAIMQAQTALTNAEAAVSSAMTDDAKLAAYREVQRAADDLVTALTTHGGSDAAIAAAASKSGKAMVMADNLAQKISADTAAADAAMKATAAKLYAGIGNAPIASSGPDARSAVYTDISGESITVFRGTTTRALLADDKTMVDANRGWEGRRYSLEPTTGSEAGTTYEMVTYSNVEAPTPGSKFSEQYTANFADGVLNSATTEGDPTKVASSNFDQSAGVKAFKLPTNNVAVMLPGSFHGVSGTYSCVPGDGNTCAAQVAANGFTLGAVADADNNPNTPVVFTAGNGTWTFKPSNPDALVTGVPDTSYVSYGWWIQKSADGAPMAVSAFHTARGAVPSSLNIGPLQGTATYSGGAVGKYALYSSTGGTNDAGHFTADATLEADFNTDTVTGTIDNFMGADGMSRNWEVELKKSGMNLTFGIINTAQTAWTIGETAAAAGGTWTGRLRNNGTDGVPKVASGVFHSTYSRSGTIVGAFGANKQ